MNITRRGFLKALGALAAAPAISKAHPVIEQPCVKPKKETNLIEAISDYKTIGGLYKDNELIVAFKDWEIEQTSDMACPSLSGEFLPVRTYWCGIASCVVDSRMSTIDVTDKFKAIFIHGDMLMYFGNVILTDQTIRTSVHELININVGFSGIGELRYGA